MTIERFNELKAEYEELRATFTEVDQEMNRRFPRGFTGNGVPGDFEGLEAEWSYAEIELRNFLEGDDGKEFNELRAVFDK